MLNDKEFVFHSRPTTLKEIPIILKVTWQFLWDNLTNVMNVRIQIKDFPDLPEQQEYQCSVVLKRVGNSLWVTRTAVAKREK